MGTAPMKSMKLPWKCDLEKHFMAHETTHGRGRSRVWKEKVHFSQKGWRPKKKTEVQETVTTAAILVYTLSPSDKLHYLMHFDRFITRIPDCSIKYLNRPCPICIVGEWGGRGECTCSLCTPLDPPLHGIRTMNWLLWYCMFHWHFMETS